MKQVQFWQHAPEGHAFPLAAFDGQIGSEVDLKVDDARVVTVKIISAEVNRHDGCKSVLLTIEVGDDIEEYFSDAHAVYHFEANTQR